MWLQGGSCSSERARGADAAAPQQRTYGGVGIGVQRVEAVPVPAQARDGSHRQSPSCQKLSVRAVSAVCAHIAELQNPRCRGWQNYEHGSTASFAQICNNRWCLTSKIAGNRHCRLGVERAMRKSKEEAAETRARIIRKASKEFNQHGIAGTGLADVMKSAGLTHGGFYKHFQSKDELVAEALEKGLENSFQAIENAAGERAIAEFINEYLSPVHRDDFDNACPLPALGTELCRAGGKTRQKASEGVLRFVSLVEKRLKGLPAEKRKSRAHAIVAALVGSMMLSRIVTDPKLSDRLLRDTRDFMLRPDC